MSTKLINTITAYPGIVNEDLTTLTNPTFNGWGSSTLPTLVGTVSISWNGTRRAKSVTRLSFTWPIEADNCSSILLNIPFSQQCRPGGMGAYLSKENIAYNQVADSSDWIGPSTTLTNKAIARCTSSYSNSDCSSTFSVGTWYGPGSNYSSYTNVYFKFTGISSSNISPGETYYIYIIQEQSGNCSFYGDASETITLNYNIRYTVNYKNPDGTNYATDSVYEGNSHIIRSSGPSKSSSSSKVTVTFDGNGGTPNKTSETATNTTSYSLSSWNTNSSGSGTTYSKGGSYTINSNLTLYPIYSGSTSYGSLTAATASKSSTTSTRTVTFDANGGSCTTASLNSTKTDTYTCNGWYTSTSGGTRLATSGGSMTPQSTRTVYAQWTTNSGSYNSVILPTPTRSGYKFLGWATDASADSGMLEDYTPSSNITLYAIWEALATMFVKVSSTYKAGAPYVKVNNTWKKAIGVYVKVNGEWKLSTR